MFFKPREMSRKSQGELSFWKRFRARQEKGAQWFDGGRRAPGSGRELDYCFLFPSNGSILATPFSLFISVEKIGMVCFKARAFVV